MEFKSKWNITEKMQSLRSADVLSGKDAKAIEQMVGNENKLTFPLPLLHTWTWWYHEPNSGHREEWIHKLHSISSVSFAQDYWRLSNNLKPPSQLPAGADYYIFKTGISPIWKTAANERGSQALLTLKRDESTYSRTVDTCWQQFSIALLSGQFGKYCAAVNGTFVRVRRTLFEIGFWMHSEATPQERDVIREAASALSESVGCVQYFPHNVGATLSLRFG